MVFSMFCKKRGGSYEPTIVVHDYHWMCTKSVLAYMNGLLANLIMLGPISHKCQPLKLTIIKYTLAQQFGTKSEPLHVWMQKGQKMLAERSSLFQPEQFLSIQ